METNPTNPYEAPQSEITVPSTGPELATPWIRLGAALIDALVLLPINFILALFLLKMMPNKIGVILVSVIGIAVFLGINFNFLKNGQTVGKKLLKLQVQRRSDSTVLPVQEYILKRLGPIYAVSFVAALVHPLINIVLTVDALCIFRPGRNTLHDDFAGTKVVRLPA